MVQAALRVLLNRETMVLQGFNHQLGSLGTARGRVADFVQAEVETAKVVDGLQRRGKAHGRRGGLPVRADDHDGAWRGNGARYLLHGRARRAGLQGEGGGSVGNK